MAPVSGCTPRLFDMSASGTVNPYAFMLEVIDSERCAGIAAITVQPAVPQELQRTANI